MTLTNRLMVFFLGALAVVLVGFSGAIYFSAHRYLHQQADERVDAAMNTLLAAIEVSPQGVEWEPGERPIRMTARKVSSQVEWAINDNRGKLVDHAPGDTSEKLSVRANEFLDRLPSGINRVDWAGQPWHISQTRVRPKADAPLPKPWDGGKEIKYPELVATVAVPLGDVQAALTTLALCLVSVSTGGWLVALVAGRWICRRALAPVTHMAESAKGISAADLSERLPAPGTGDELDLLSREINGLLDRLQESFDRQQRFTGDASHQLRTPLTALLGQVEVALRRPRPPEEYEATLSAVQRQGVHLQKIVESLLFLARADAESRLPNLERLDLSSWLQTHAAAWSVTPRGQDLRLELAAAPACWVEAQSAMLAELVNNLLDNAAKYSPAGAPITLRLGRHGADATLAVEDEGIGLREEDLPRLFEPFFRSSEARRRGVGGIGLGLAVAMHRVRFGGSIVRGDVACRRQPLYRDICPPSSNLHRMGKKWRLATSSIRGSLFDIAGTGGRYEAISTIGRTRYFPRCLPSLPSRPEPVALRALHNYENDNLIRVACPRLCVGMAESQIHRCLTGLRH